MISVTKILWQVVKPVATIVNIFLLWNLLQFVTNWLAIVLASKNFH